MTPTPARLVAPALLATALVTALALTGCSGSNDSDSAGSSSAEAPAMAQDGIAADQELSSRGGDVDTADSYAVAGAAEAPAGKTAPVGKAAPAANDLTGTQQALIRKGNVALRADDVGRAQIEVQKVVDRYAGQVTEEKTQSDDEGRPAYTRMVLRVPSDDFNDAVEDLKGIGELESANTNEDDVTTEVIDVQTRLKVQKRSIARITILFQRAESIRDIMAIESELSQRQADLEALERQAAYLANQTSLSTIVVSVDQIPEKKEPAPKKDDESGFLAGLDAGWGALAAFAVGLATALGALLPWLVVAAVIGIPTLLLVRALRRRTTPSSPSQ